MIQQQARKRRRRYPDTVFSGRGYYSNAHKRKVVLEDDGYLQVGESDSKSGKCTVIAIIARLGMGQQGQVE